MFCSEAQTGEANASFSKSLSSGHTNVELLLRLKIAFFMYSVQSHVGQTRAIAHSAAQVAEGEDAGSDHHRAGHFLVFWVQFTQLSIGFV